jgi:hypothetical protein
LTTTTTTTTSTSTAAASKKIGGNVSAVNSAGREAAAGPAVPAADDGAALVGLDHDRPWIAHPRPGDPRRSTDVHVPTAKLQHDSQRLANFNFNFHFFNFNSGRIRKIPNSKRPRERKIKKRAVSWNIFGCVCVCV